MAQEKAPAKEQSMEEILQSIKRIIAEENDGEETTLAKGSEVLELTDLVDEGSSPNGHHGANGTSKKAEASLPKTEISTKALDAFEEVVAPALREEDLQLEEKGEFHFSPAIEPVEKPAVKEAPKDVLRDIDSLLSTETRKASSSALRALTEASHRPLSIGSAPVQFRSGTTVEDLVVEALKPMLKDWLDSNLTSIVERLVEKEIRKLSN